MSVQLKLDASAIAVLFPEGSEVRLELQQAVINEVSRKIIDREVRNLGLQITAQCTKITSEALQAQGLVSKVWQGVKLSDATEAQLKGMAQSAATAAVSKAMYEAMAPYVADLDARIKEYADIELQVRMNAMAKAALQNALK